MASKVAAPKNTGGGGEIFETEVCASLLAGMLAGEPPLEPELGTLERLDFQTRVDGWYLDDVLLTTRVSDNRHRIALSIKSNAQFTATSAPRDFVECAWEQWLHLSSSVFDRAADYMGLVTASISQSARTALNGLFLKVHSADPDGFASRISTPGWASEDEREMFQSFACPASMARSHPSADQERAHMLLRLRFLEYDFGQPNSSSLKQAHRICRDALRSRDPVEARKLWDTLRSITDELRPAAGALTRQALIDRLRGRFELAVHPARSLASALDEATRTWASTLPAGEGLDPALVLPGHLDGEDLEQRPAWQALRARLFAKRVPTLMEWHQSLIEQWQRVRATADRAAPRFFLLSETEARAALRDLAVAVVGICEQDEELFQGTVLDQLEELIARSGGGAPHLRPVDPFPWSERSTLRDVALAVEQALGARVELIVIDEDAASIHIWCVPPGSTILEIKQSLITVLCLLSGHPELQTIEIGISGDTSIEGSDGGGDIAMMKLQFPATDVRVMTATRAIPTDF